MHLDVRQANASDSEAIACLGSVTFANAYGAIVRSEDMAGYVAGMFDPATIAEEIGKGRAHYFVAVSDGAVVGYAKLCITGVPAVISSEISGQTMELVRLYVDDHHYGLGIGGNLLALVCETAAALGCDSLWLRVWQKNEGAIRFYCRHGFTVQGSEPYLIGETANPVALMIARLG